MPGPKDVRSLLKVLQGGKGSKADKALEAVRGEQAIEKASAKATSILTEKLPVKIKHPFTEERFVFPPGTDPEEAKKMVTEFLLKKAREGEEKIDMPSQLPQERIKELEAAEKELEHAKTVIKDLESRKDLSKVGPGLYQDENTGRYFTVDHRGHIKEARVGDTDGFYETDDIEEGQELLRIDKNLQDPKTSVLMDQFEQAQRRHQELRDQYDELTRTHQQPYNEEVYQKFQQWSRDMEENRRRLMDLNIEIDRLKE